MQLQQFLKQMFAFFIDGTHMALTGFDRKQGDKAYIALLENTVEDMASSHQIKRFFAKLSILPNNAYRKVLHKLFIWRLKIEKPAIIELGVDTMVLDNETSKKKEGNERTYKKRNGFQPLQITWGPFIVDALFRRGSAHSCHGTDFTDCVKDVVNLIRKEYFRDVPIILCADSGFASQEAYTYFEEVLKIHYIITSRVYASAESYIRQIPYSSFKEFTNGPTSWGYAEFGNKLESWHKFRRCIFTHVAREGDGQYVIATCKSDSLIYTNIGLCKEVDQRLREVSGNKYFEATAVISKSHQRGRDELVHRSVKELATKEQLPFKRFGMNRAYYFLLIVTHFLFETYKRDVAKGVVNAKVYPNTFRRGLIDFAVKITSQSRYTILNAARPIYEALNIHELWIRCQSPPTIQFA